MDSLNIPSTLITPAIQFDAESGVFSIKGCSIPVEADIFWKPVLSWIEVYSYMPKESTRVIFELAYFNISTSNNILQLLYSLREIVNRSYNVQIEWHYASFDDDMYEVGQDFAFMAKLPFEFIASSSIELI